MNRKQPKPDLVVCYDLQPGNVEGPIFIAPMANTVVKSADDAT